jgi:NAD+ kinase
MQRIGIVYRAHPPSAIELATAIETWLTAQGIATWKQEVERDHEIAAQIAPSDLIIVLGGDGTILSVARQCAGDGTPLLGVNFGHVGFLAELEPDEVLEQLPYYLRRECWVDERTMLSGALRANGAQQTFLALNDIVVARGPEPRVIRFTIRVDDAFYASVTADGMIVATATGSTAYNLAAGGPILYPSVHGMVVTPIAPHLAVDPPLVLDPSARVELELAGNSGPAVLAADGQLIWPFDGEATVTITTSPHVTRFLRRRPRNHFYQVLTEKLRGR